MDNFNQPYRRRNYFIEKGFQASFIFKFFLLVFAGGALTAALLYWFSAKSTTVAIVDSRVVVRSTADFILPLLIQTVIVTSLLVGLATVFVTLFISHRIAGPIFRFKKALNSLKEGDFSSEVRIRQADQLQGLATEFDETVRVIRIKLNNVKNGLKNFKSNPRLKK